MDNGTDIILKCPHCGSRDEYYLTGHETETSVTACTNCLAPFNIVDGRVLEAQYEKEIKEDKYVDCRLVTCPNCGHMEMMQLGPASHGAFCENCRTSFPIPPLEHAAKYKPFRGMPERTEAENAQYHRQMIEDGLKKIMLWQENEQGGLIMNAPKIKMNASDAIDYLQAVNAMCINTASLSWVLGMIEFIGDMEQSLEEQKKSGFTKMSMVELYNSLRDTLRTRKDANYEIMKTLKDNLRTLEAFLQAPPQKS